MRGQSSRHRCALPVPPRRRAGGQDSAPPRVLADFGENLPVGAAELDAFEAFLMPMINELLVQTNEKPDSEVPQRYGMKEDRKRQSGGTP